MIVIGNPLQIYIIYRKIISETKRKHLEGKINFFLAIRCNAKWSYYYMGLHEITIIKQSGETLFEKRYDELAMTESASKSLVNAFLSALLQFAEVGMGLELHEVRIGGNTIIFKKWENFFVVLMVDLTDNIADYSTIQDRIGSSFSTYWSKITPKPWDGNISAVAKGFMPIADGIIFGLSDKDVNYQLSDELKQIAKGTSKQAVKEVNK